MAQRAGGSVRLVTSVAVLALAGAGLLVQAGFMAREARDQLSSTPRHELRLLLTEADKIIPPGVPYAITSDVRADNARYVLYPRRRVQVRFTQDALERSGVRYVIVTTDARPPALQGTHSWYRVLVQSPVGRLIEVRG
jgi:hypothetical protein